MIKVLRRLFVTLLFTLSFTPSVMAADASDSNGGGFDVLGKVVDHDYLEFANQKFYLPRILYSGDEWYMYRNTASAIESGEFVDTESGLVRADGAAITLDMSITSHLLYVWFGIILTLFVTGLATRKYRSGVGVDTAPKGALHNLFEVFFVFIRDEIAKAYIPGDKYEKYVPYLFSVFMVIAFMNTFGLLPWGVSATADLTVTAILAFITFIITQFSGTKDHWKHVFWFPGVPVAVKFLMMPVELIGLFTKPLALAIRLFANMLSGKIMIICILGLIFIFTDLFGAYVGVGSGIVWVALTSVLYALKLFVALLQAYIFTLLSAVFIGMAAEEHHHADHEDDSTRLSRISTVENA
jgi:F-type H+-transporting ATPase subunit a